MRPGRDRAFYIQEIHEFISECTHGGVMDEEEFKNKISGLQAAAFVDGFNQVEFQKWVSEIRFIEVEKKTA